MNLDFYISEMSVSNLHGGGLTIQRVLGEDLSQFKFFVHVSRFATDYPVIDRYRQNSLDLPVWAELDSSRRLIGSRPAKFIENCWTAQRWHGRRSAAAIAARHSRINRPLKGLVCPQGVASLHTIDYLTRRHAAEYVTWIMDDHLIRWESGDWHYPNSEVESLYARHLRNAKGVFVISPAMGEFYQNHFGVKSVVLFGPADIASPQGHPNPVGKRSLRLGYFGSVGLWQQDALEMLAGKLTDLDATLDIYTFLKTVPGNLSQKGVSLAGGLPAAKVVETMRTYDAVILPISFRSEMRHMTDFNIATKMSECLASGTATLVVGPKDAAMTRYLQTAGAACIITEGSPSEWQRVGEQLRDSLCRAQILNAAQKLLEQNLSTQVMRNRWRTELDNFLKSNR
jgi:hypothetical protein